MGRTDVIVSLPGSTTLDDGTTIRHRFRAYWAEHQRGTAFTAAAGRHAGFYAGKEYWASAEAWQRWNRCAYNDLINWCTPLIRDAAMDGAASAVLAHRFGCLTVRAVRADQEVL